MTRHDNIQKLPKDLPILADDGACDHLPGMSLPSIPLRTTQGQVVDLATVAERTVVYAYPRISRPDQKPLPGGDEIPGARGCTPQSCAFSEHHQELQQLQAGIYGLSTQDTAYQKEAVERLHLPFPFLSDQSMVLIKRVTLIIREGNIEHVFYPVLLPDRNADDVIIWLQNNP